MDYNEELQALLDISIALSAEKNHNKLFNLIITKSMDVANCDAGTLYLYEDEKLHFKIMKTLSMNVDKGSDGSAIDLPPVELKPENIYTRIVGNKCLQSAFFYAIISARDNNSLSGAIPGQRPKGGKKHEQV